MGILINSSGKVTINNGSRVIMANNSLPLILTFDVTIPVVNPTNVNQWNTFFDLPNNGNPFKSVIVSGTNQISVSLFGGSNIKIVDGKFQSSRITSIDDRAGCIRELGNDVFRQAVGLNNAKLPSIKYAGSFCFNLTKIQNVFFPLLEEVGNNCFDSCTSVVKYDLPSLKISRAGAFQYSSNAGTFNLPSLTIAYSFSFTGCNSVSFQSIILPSLTILGTYCFWQCSRLESAYLPEATSVGLNAFANNTSIKSVYLPKCTILGSSTGYNTVFLNVTSMTSATFNRVLATNNTGGTPDGDIQNLISTNPGLNGGSNIYYYS